MNKYKIIEKIEKFAPLETAESWDASGWLIETSKIDVSKIMLCLTPTKSIIEQAQLQNCDMIISHHPMFAVPYEYKTPTIDMYCAHTNLDKANGGTTDTIIKCLGFEEYQTNCEHEFLRTIEIPQEISIPEFSKKISIISPNARIINNRNVKILKKIAFCAGSGSEFISDAKKMGADCLVTGDLKFHTALESEIVVYDICHFESEIIILPVLKHLICDNDIEIIYANEKSPFSQI